MGERPREMTAKEFWLAKVQERVAAVQVTFVKPVNDLVEAINNYVVAEQQEKMMLKEKEKVQQQKQKSDLKQ